MSTLNFGSPKTESLHWSGGQLLFTTDSNGNVDDVKVGSLADYIPGATASTRLTVWDRDLNGSIASAHNGTGNAIWANQPVQDSVCAPTPIFENSLGYETNPTPGFTLPSGLASVFGTRFVVPTGLFIASRTDNVTNQLTTFQGTRVYDPSKKDWMTPDAVAGDVDDPESQRAYAYDGNNPVKYEDPSGFSAREGGASQGGGFTPTVVASDLGATIITLSDAEAAYNYYITLAGTDLAKGDDTGAYAAMAAAATIKSSNLSDAEADAALSGKLRLRTSAVL